MALIGAAQIRQVARAKRINTVSRQGRKGRLVGTDRFVYITGVEAVSASFIHASTTAQTKAMSITDRAARSVWAAQRNSVPVASGHTRKSIRNTVEASRDGNYVRSIGPAWPLDRAPVARFLVFGTVKMSPKWDFFGASQPPIDTWMADMEQAARVI